MLSADNTTMPVDCYVYPPPKQPGGSPDGVTNRRQDSATVGGGAQQGGHPSRAAHVSAQGARAGTAAGEGVHARHEAGSSDDDSETDQGSGLLDSDLGRVSEYDSANEDETAWARAFVERGGKTPLDDSGQ